MPKQNQRKQILIPVPRMNEFPEWLKNNFVYTFHQVF